MSLFLDAEYALSHADIEQEICKKFDRVTIYRTLHTLHAAGLLHTIRDDSGLTRFALVLSSTSDPHTVEHLHFKCNACGHIYCVPDFNIKDIDLPENFDVHSLTMSAEGICKYCKHNKTGDKTS
ncbi:transcriptional repressor [candidate division KSB1 bacterium]|nr:transcriptional repressor [candidate division KSB1 bacterium]